jgi:type I restriction enzyme S subunit
MSNWVSTPIGALLKAQFSGEWGAAPDSHGELVRVFRGADFVSSGRLERGGGALRRISPAKLSKLQLKPGDILLEKSGGSPDQPVGRVSYFEGADSRAVASNFLQTLRPKDEVDSKFLFYLLQHAYACGRVLPFQQQTTGIINFHLRDYLKEEVHAPESRDEQSRIAGLLSAVDEQIHSVCAVVSKLTKTRAGVAARILSADEDRIAYPKVPLARLIAGLESGVSVNADDRPVVASSEVGVLKTSCVIGGRFISQENKCVWKTDARRVRVSPRKGCIIVSRMNTPELVGECGLVRDDHPNLFLPDRLWLASPSSADVSSSWLNECLQWEVVRKRIRDAATGTSNSMKNISKPAFLAIEVPTPPPAQQKRIAAVLEALNEQISQEQSNVEKLGALKDGLLHQLMRRE